MKADATNGAIALMPMTLFLSNPNRRNARLRLM